MFKFLRRDKPRPQPTSRPVDHKLLGGRPTEGEPFKPLIGQSVHVHHRIGALVPGQPEAAIVCSIGTRSMIRVVGFDANGDPFKAELVFHVDPRVPKPVSAHATWRQ